jgi:hypothetical protein
LSNERELPGFLADTGYDGTETVDLGAGCWAKVKRCLDRGELAEAEHALTQATVDMDGNGQLAPDVSTYRTLMVTHSIVEWNLTDPDGMVWPLAPEPAKAASVGRLPGPASARIWGRVNQLNAAPTGDEQARFPGRDIGSGPAGTVGAAEPGPVPTGGGTVESPGPQA